MIDNSPHNRGFFATIPGILTALAAVITAVAGAYFGVHGRHDSDPAAQRPVVVNLSTSSQAAPTDATAVDGADLRIDAASTEVTSTDTAAGDLVDQCGSGDMQACVDLLDTLARECKDGYGLSCDMLFLVSPEDSDYEMYGATCGGRFDESVAGSCEEQ
jgi:hypothetical protein